jgi:hypothetical protein
LSTNRERERFVGTVDRERERCIALDRERERCTSARNQERLSSQAVAAGLLTLRWRLRHGREVVVVNGGCCDRPRSQAETGTETETETETETKPDTLSVTIEGRRAVKPSPCSKSSCPHLPGVAPHTYA